MLLTIVILKNYMIKFGIENGHSEPKGLFFKIVTIDLFWETVIILFLSQA